MSAFAHVSDSSRERRKPSSRSYRADGRTDRARVMARSGLVDRVRDRTAHVGTGRHGDCLPVSHSRSVRTRRSRGERASVFASVRRFGFDLADGPATGSDLGSSRRLVLDQHRDRLCTLGVAAAAAPLLARAFGHPELASVAIALGTSFAVNGIAVQPLAVLARRLRFGATFWVETAGVGAGGVVVVGLATAGCGPWALVGQTLASALVRAALALGMSGYAPRWPRFGSETAGLIRFGGYVAAYGLVNAAARNMDNVLIGSVWGLEALGYYTRAYFLMTVPLLLSSQALAGPTIPALSAVAYDAERLGRVYRSAAHSRRCSAFRSPRVCSSSRPRPFGCFTGRVGTEPPGSSVGWRSRHGSDGRRHFRLALSRPRAAVPC